MTERSNKKEWSSGMRRRVERQKLPEFSEGNYFFHLQAERCLLNLLFDLKMQAVSFPKRR
jgi:hypothetical protein